MHLNPFTYRPVDPEDIDWENNAISNAMAWASPALCATEKQWAVRLTLYFYTTCACCLLLRGVILGLVAGAVLAYVATSLI